MIEIEKMPNDFCPEDCAHKDWTLHTDTLFCDIVPYINVVQVACQHEKVCAMWAKKQGMVTSNESINSMAAVGVAVGLRGKAV